MIICCSYIFSHSVLMKFEASNILTLRLIMKRPNRKRSSVFLKKLVVDPERCRQSLTGTSKQRPQSSRMDFTGSPLNPESDLRSFFNESLTDRKDFTVSFCASGALCCHTAGLPVVARVWTPHHQCWASNQLLITDYISKT